MQQMEMVQRGGRLLLALVLPPAGVYLKTGTGLQFRINIVLTLLGYIPGLLHALYFFRPGIAYRPARQPPQPDAA